MARFPFARKAHASDLGTDDAHTIPAPQIDDVSVDLLPAPVDADQAHADRLAGIDTALGGLHDSDRDRAASKVRDRWQTEIDSLHEHGRLSAYTSSLDAIESALSVAIQEPTDSALRVRAVTRQQQRDALTELSADAEALARALDSIRKTADELATSAAVAVALLTHEQYPQTDRASIADALLRATLFTDQDDSHGETAATLRELSGRANTARYNLRAD
jgi:hypothetical protein